SVMALGALLLSSAETSAAPPSPQLKARIDAGEIAKPPFMENLEFLHAKGVCSPAKVNAVKTVMRRAQALRNASGNNSASGNSSASGSPAVVTTFRALAILVDFSDNGSTVTAPFFDTMLFSTASGSVHDYYSEISYGQLDLVTVNLPSALGWNRAPKTYSYYVNNLNGTGAYPQNSQKLCEDLVDQVDGLVDFSVYDNDGNGTVDVLIIIHAGSGAEFTGASTDIWSHKWGISPRLKDGVTISDYTIQPEYWMSPGDLTIGVYAHELGHGFGLPDLYDTDNSSWGLGRWSLMASGSWNGPGNLGSSPAHPDAWSRIDMGFATATNITTNTSSSAIPSVNSGDNIYRLWNGGALGSEYFLVTNRQKTGYDSYLPASGILVWHIDNSQSGNTNEWYPGNTGSGHYKVALEQADGLWNLDKKVDLGSAADPFSTGTGATFFSPISTPNSNSYSGTTTFVAVSNIGASADTMYADFSVSLLAGLGDEDPKPFLPEQFSLQQNYPNPFNPSTTISFDLPKSTQVTVTVYNVLGQIVDVIADGVLSQGAHTVTWGGTNSSGAVVASGIYFYEVVTEDNQESKKMSLLK
ncbi:M6 family metalloprotease domain-containing protein, partial [bacterium AH-315-J21]|nr:M6 family metalloprotease domain-containing protein [bacterium AH-315-J21]